MLDRITQSICPGSHGDRYVIVLQKGDHVYSFVWDPGQPSQRDQLLQQIGRFACRPDLDFTWSDATVIAHRVRKVASR